MNKMVKLVATQETTKKPLKFIKTFFSKIQIILPYKYRFECLYKLVNATD